MNNGKSLHSDLCVQYVSVLCDLCIGPSIGPKRNNSCDGFMLLTLVFLGKFGRGSIFVLFCRYCRIHYFENIKASKKIGN